MPLNRNNRDFWRKALLPADATLQQAIRNLDQSGLQIVVVVENGDTLIGTITDGDIRRGLLEHTGPYGEALACVIAYEKGDFLRAHFDRLAPSQMTDAYVSSAHWADQSSSSMSSEPAA